MEELRQWLEGPRFAVKVVHGVGGAGKSRLVQEFAEQCTDWIVREGFYEPYARIDVHQKDHSANDDEFAERLIVVDYAERWPPDAMRRLLRDAYDGPARKVRVLLISRPSKWWLSEIDDFVTRVLMSKVDTLSLGPWARSQDDAADYFQLAYRRFSEIHGSVGSEIGPPKSQPTEVSPLALQIVALAEVLGARNGDPYPDPTSATAFILKRERAYWSSSLRTWEGAGARTVDDLEKAALAITLLGGGSASDVDQACMAMGFASDLPDARELRRLYLRCYPPEHHALNTLAPLRPDRLAEDYVASVLPPPDGDIERMWAQDALFEFFEHADNETLSRLGTRVLRTLVETAKRHSAVKDGQLLPLVAAHTDLVFLDQGQALLALSQIADVPLLNRLVNEPAAQSSPKFAQGWAASLERLWYEDLPNSQSGRAKTKRARTLSAAMLRAGRYSEAYDYARVALSESSLYASSGGDDDKDDYVYASVHLAHAALGLLRFEEACDVASVAERFTENTVFADEIRGFEIRASALHSLGTALLRNGEADAASRYLREAISIRQQIPGPVSATVVAGLADSYNNLGSMLATQPATQNDGVSLLEEAVRLRRMLVEDGPDEHGFRLGESLSNLGAVYQRVGNDGAARHTLEEAVEWGRQAYEANAEGAVSSFTSALENLSTCLCSAGSELDCSANPDHSIAVTLYKEALDARERHCGSSLPLRFELLVSESRLIGHLVRARDFDEAKELLALALSEWDTNVRDSEHRLPQMDVGEFYARTAEAARQLNDWALSFRLGRAAVFHYKHLIMRLDHDELHRFGNLLNGTTESGMFGRVPLADLRAHADEAVQVGTVVANLLGEEGQLIFGQAHSQRRLLESPPPSEGTTVRSEIRVGLSPDGWIVADDA